METVITLQKLCLYGGALFFVLHILNNKLRFNKKTATFVIAPYVCQIGVKWAGYLWVDWTLDQQGLFAAYKIYD